MRVVRPCACVRVPVEPVGACRCRLLGRWWQSRGRFKLEGTRFTQREAGRQKEAGRVTKERLRARTGGPSATKVPGESLSTVAVAAARRSETAGTRATAEELTERKAAAVTKGRVL